MNLIQADVNLIHIKDLLGHAYISISEIYAANVKKNLDKQRFELYRGEGVVTRRDEGIKCPPCGGQYTGH